MRKVIAVAIVLVALVMTYASGTAESLSEQFLAILKTANSAYGENTKTLSADQIIWAYTIYEMYINAKMMESAQTGTLPEDLLKELVSGQYSIGKILNDEYSRWLDGEIDNATFGDEVMTFIDVVISYAK
jgi:hypothetical protein